MRPLLRVRVRVRVHRVAFWVCQTCCVSRQGYLFFTTVSTPLHTVPHRAEEKKKKKEKKGDRDRAVGKSGDMRSNRQARFVLVPALCSVVDFLGRRPRKILRTPGCCISAETKPSWRRMLRVGRPGRMSDGEGSPRDKECHFYCLSPFSSGSWECKLLDVELGVLLIDGRTWHVAGAMGYHRPGLTTRVGWVPFRSGMSSPGETLPPFTSKPRPTSCR